MLFRLSLQEADTAGNEWGSEWLPGMVVEASSKEYLDKRLPPAPGSFGSWEITPIEPISVDEVTHRIHKALREKRRR